MAILIESKTITDLWLKNPLRPNTSLFTAVKTTWEPEVEIPGNHFEALSTSEDNSNKIILFLKYIDMYYSIKENQCINM